MLYCNRCSEETKEIYKGGICNKCHVERPSKATTIDELIEELQALPNRQRLVTIVVGDMDDNCVDAERFEIHHAEDDDHPIELFIEYACKGEWCRDLNEVPEGDN
jgi:hypothetical protein